MDAPSSTAYLQRLLDLLRSGDDAARNALLSHSLERIRMLARRMFRKEFALRRLEETDDIVQKAMIRLYRALDQVTPTDVRELVGLAARQIRWVLLNLARDGAARRTKGTFEQEKDGLKSREGEPSDLAEWSEFHTLVDSLPDEEREMFDLLVYEGVTQPEAAALLETSLRTVKRRWQRARLLLQEKLHGDWPSLDEGQR